MVAVQQTPTTRRTGDSQQSKGAGASLAECFLVGVVVAVAVRLLMPGPFGPGSYGDDGAYLSLGKALAHGWGYRSVYAVGTPHHVKFPPLFPALLSVFWRLEGDVFAVVRVARLTNAVCLGIAAALLWPLGRNRLRISRVPLAALVVAPLLLEANLYYFSLPLSEPLFILLWSVALVLADRLAFGKRGRGSFVAFGVVLAAAALTRGQGLVLLAAAPIALWIMGVGRRRALISIAVAAVPVALWQAIRTAWIAGGAAVGAEDSYLRELLGSSPVEALRTLEGSVVFNLRAYPGLLATYFAPAIWGRIAIGLLFGLALFGVLRLLRQAPFLAISVALELVLVVFWPYTVDRLALTLLPFVGLAAAYRLDLDLRRMPGLLRSLATVTLLALAALIGFRQIWIRQAEHHGGPGFYTPAALITAVSRDTRLISGWVDENTDSAEVIFVSWPEGVYLLTGRQTVNADPAESRTGQSVHGEPAATFARRLLSDRVSVAVASSAVYASTHDVESLLASCPGFLRPVATLDTTGYPAVYRVTPREPSCDRVRSLDPASGP